jgi:rubrerythrin
MNEKINDLLIEALNSEIKAKEFYQDAANKAQSSTGKQFFKELADFEQNHYEKVKKIIESLNEGKTIEFKESLLKTNKSISEVKGEFEPNKDEITNIIILAIESEKKAQERYRKIAGMLIDIKEKNIFNNLAGEERNHQKILEDQFYQISNKGVIIWE